MQCTTWAKYIQKQGKIFLGNSTGKEEIQSPLLIEWIHLGSVHVVVSGIKPNKNMISE